MTPSEFAAFQRRIQALNRQIDAWAVTANDRSQKQRDALMAMLDARVLADDLMNALMDASIQHMMLESAWMDAASGWQPTAH